MIKDEGVVVPRTKREYLDTNGTLKLQCVHDFMWAADPNYQHDKCANCKIGINCVSPFLLFPERKLRRGWETI